LYSQRIFAPEPKKLYDAAPDSQMRIAVLEAEASLRSQMVDVEKEQNALMIQAYREALDTPRVAQARWQLFEQASIEHARNIAGFIEGAQDETPQRRPGYVNQDQRRGGVLD
jgi:flagellar hook-length control protein FliK